MRGEHPEKVEGMVAGSREPSLTAGPYWMGAYDYLELRGIKYVLIFNRTGPIFPIRICLVSSFLGRGCIWSPTIPFPGGNRIVTAKWTVIARNECRAHTELADHIFDIADVVAEG